MKSVSKEFIKYSHLIPFFKFCLSRFVQNQADKHLETMSTIYD